MADILPHYTDICSTVGGLDKNAWELWKATGKKKEQLGALNLLTPARILEAKKEVQAGIAVQLDWSLKNLGLAIGGRESLKHQVLDYKVSRDIYAHDDQVSFNTQTSSQWDGFAHFGDQKTGIYYNGIKHEDIIQGRNEHLGIHNWCQNGGIVGRGVLLDYVGYLESQKLEVPDPCTPHSITTEELDNIAAYQAVRWKTGDVLFIRTGFVRWFDNAADGERRKKICGTEPAFIGVKTDDGSKEWLWNHHFSAVACDTLAFEAYPTPPGATGLHDYLLARWGMPIGEMFNLETLSEVCRAQRRWEFFFTSAPLNVPGGVASPPNAIAIL